MLVVMLSCHGHVSRVGWRVVHGRRGRQVLGLRVDAVIDAVVDAVVDAMVDAVQGVLVVPVFAGVVACELLLWVHGTLVGTRDDGGGTRAPVVVGTCTRLVVQVAHHGLVRCHGTDGQRLLQLLLLLPVLRASVLEPHLRHRHRDRRDSSLLLSL